MRKLRPGSVMALFLAVTLLGGCQAIRQLQGAETGDVEVTVVGENMVGEQCRAQVAPDLEVDGRDAYELFCGRWEQPSGRVFRVEDDGRPLADWGLPGSFWASELDRRMSCLEDGPTQILETRDAFLLNCKLRNGGWPFVAMAARVEGDIYLADGIPGALPTIENTIAILSGLNTQAPEVSTRSATVEQMEALLEGRVFGSGDLQTYYQLMEVAQYYNSLKQPAEAEERYRDALAIHERFLGLDNPATADPVMHLALEISNQERYEEAEALFLRAGALLEDTTDQSDLARFISYRALHFANQGDFEEALRLAGQASEIRRELMARRNALEGGPQATTFQSFAPATRRSSGEFLVDSAAAAAIDLVQSLYIEAAMLRQLGRTDEAVKLLDDASTSLRLASVKPEWWEPELLELRARLAGEQGNIIEAEQSIALALEERRRLFRKSRPEAISFMTLGEIYAADGRVDAALDAFAEGTAIISETGDGLRYSQIEPYLNVAFQVAERRPEERDRLFAQMFKAGQLVRDGITAQSIALTAARLAQTDEGVGAIIRDLQEAERLRDLAQEAFSSQIALAAELRDEALVERLRNEVATLDTLIQELGEQVQAAAPGYNQLIDTPVSLERLQEVLEPNEALVQILLGNQGGVVFWVTAADVRAWPTELSFAEAGRGVNAVRRAFELRRDGRLNRFNTSAAHRVFELIFEPAREELEGIDHLVTIPNGPLISLPFAVLPMDRPDSVRRGDYSEVNFMARNMAISLSPSVRSFVDLRATVQPSQASLGYIGFGDFVADETPQSPMQVALRGGDDALGAQCTNDALALAVLGALPETADELREVAATFPPGSAKIFLGEDFNEEVIKTAALSDYRIVYFATHGLLPTDLECHAEPALMVSRLKDGEGAGEPGDGFLDASEILALDLDADLVVLSACNTGGGAGDMRASGGESLSGLARAFFYAGARALLVSHWAVASDETVDLMTRMFAKLRTNPDMGTAEALQIAQNGMIDAADGAEIFRTHPFFWAPFTLVGDGRRSVEIQ